MAFQEKSSLYDAELNAGCMNSHPLLRAVFDKDVKLFTQLAEEQMSGNARQEPRSTDLLSVRDKFENCVLHVASYRGSIEILKLLLHVCQCDPNVVNQQGWAPIHFSCRGNDFEALKILMARGADPALRDKQGYTAFHVAASNCDVESFSGITPLTCAAQQGNKEICVMLAKHGADIYHRNTLFENGEHQTPHRLALQHGLDLRSVGAVPEVPVPPQLSRQTQGETRIIWQPTAGRSAPVQGYKLQVRKIDRLQPDLPWITAVESIKELCFTFYTCCNNCSSYGRDKVESDLEPGEVYTVRLFAKSAVGWSEPSDPSSPFVTEAATPVMPGAPELVQSSVDALTVRWKLPQCNGAPIEKSELYWKLSHTPYSKWIPIPEQIQVLQVDSDDEASSVESDTDDEHDTSKDEVWCQYTMRNLSQNAQYRFRVRCYNFVGWSFLSPESGKMLTLSDGDVTTSDRRGANATGGNGGDESRSTSFIHQHAHKRYAMFQRVRQDTTKVSGQNQAELEGYLTAKRESSAIIKLQTWFRIYIVRKMYLRYLDDYKAQEYMLLEYDMVDQFNETWRSKLLRYKLEAEAKSVALQAIRDERRTRKIARSTRREQRQIRRRLRKNQ